MQLDYFSPKEKRYLSNIAGLIAQRRVALFLGAGIDMALCEGMIDWTDLVRKMLDMSKTELPDEFIYDNLQALPTVGRHKTGDKVYIQKIIDEFKYTTPKSPTKRGPIISSLRSLADYIPLVVTTNYSSEAYKALGDDRPIALLNTLKSVHVPNPGGESEKLFIHLHGKTDSPILDATGYRGAEYGEILYYEFLRELLSKWTVLFCGLSFTDPPLRAAVTQVKHRHPEISHNHFLIQTEKREPWGSIPETQFKLQILGRAFSYDVQTLRMEKHADLPKVFNTIDPRRAAGKIFLSTNASEEVKDLILGATVEGKLSPLADFFDNSGDYESASLRLFCDIVTDEDIKILAKKLMHLAGNISTPSELNLLLRIEKHLRHILYIGKGNLSDFRFLIWEAISKEWDRKSNLQRLDEYKLETIAEFYYGIYELGEGNPSLQTSNLSNIRARLVNKPKYKSRIKIAEKVWTTKPNERNINEFENLHLMAFDAGWESIDAKCCVDIVRSKIIALKASITNNKIPAKNIDEIQTLSNQAKHIAKVAGTARRYICALLFSAIWMPDRAEAQAAVRAAIELCMQFSKPMVEHKLWEGVLWVWFLVNENDIEALHEVEKSAVPENLRDSQYDYWKEYLSPFYSA